MTEKYEIVKGGCGTGSHWTIIFAETGDQVACRTTKKAAKEYVAMSFSQKMAAPFTK